MSGELTMPLDAGTAWVYKATEAHPGAGSWLRIALRTRMG
jgi:hypothetical protein